MATCGIFIAHRAALYRVRSDLSLESESMLKDVFVVEGYPRVMHVLHFAIVTIAHAACKVETKQ